mgnify:CR=1 FL=1
MSRARTYSAAELESSEELQREVFGETFAERRARQQAAAHPRGCQCADCRPQHGIDS